MIKKITLFILSFLVFSTDLKPILDGRSAPIYVDTRYTFSDYEWAMGDVYFRNGINVPAGRNALLDINSTINGSILAEGGTILTRGGRTLKVKGGIYSGLNSKTIFDTTDGTDLSLEWDLDISMLLTAKAEFRKPGTLNMQGNAIQFYRSYPGSLLLNFGSGTFVIKNATVADLADYDQSSGAAFSPRLQSTGGGIFSFKDCLLQYSNSMTVTECSLNLEGNSQLSFVGKVGNSNEVTIFSSLTCNSSNLSVRATPIIGPDATLTFTSVDRNTNALLADRATLTLKDSTVQFTRRLQCSGEVATTFITIDGTSTIRALSPTTAEKSFFPTTNINILAGSTLILDGASGTDYILRK